MGPIEKPSTKETEKIAELNPLVLNPKQASQYLGISTSSDALKNSQSYRHFMGSLGTQVSESWPPESLIWPFISLGGCGWRLDWFYGQGLIRQPLLYMASPHGLEPRAIP